MESHYALLHSYMQELYLQERAETEFDRSKFTALRVHESAQVQVQIGMSQTLALLYMLVHDSWAPWDRYYTVIAVDGHSSPQYVPYSSHGTILVTFFLVLQIRLSSSRRAV